MLRTLNLLEVFSDGAETSLIRGMAQVSLLGSQFEAHEGVLGLGFEIFLRLIPQSAQNLFEAHWRLSGYYILDIAGRKGTAVRGS